MADLLIWLVAALGAVGGVVLARVWGRVEGKRAGKREAERDAIEDTVEKVERGRDAVRDGRGAGDPADRSAGRRSTGAPPWPASPPQRWALVMPAAPPTPRRGSPGRPPRLSQPCRRTGRIGSPISTTA